MPYIYIPCNMQSPAYSLHSPKAPSDMVCTDDSIIYSEEDQWVEASKCASFEANRHSVQYSQHGHAHYLLV